MELVDNGLGRHADSGDEEAGLLGDDDIDELAELALCVVVARRTLARILEEWADGLLGLAGAATDLREEQIDTERTVLVVEMGLELGDLLAEHVRSVADLGKLSAYALIRKVCFCLHLR